MYILYLLVHIHIINRGIRVRFRWNNFQCDSTLSPGEGEGREGVAAGRERRARRSERARAHSLSPRHRAAQVRLEWDEAHGGSDDEPTLRRVCFLWIPLCGGRGVVCVCVCVTACSDERAGAHMSSERATGAGRARASVSRW